MLRFIMIMIGMAAAVFTTSVAIRYGLKGALAWDNRICNKLNRNYTFENYFSTQWWALRASAYVTLLLFFGTIFNWSIVESYYSFALISENGFSALFTSGSTVWYLNMVNILYFLVFTLIVIESIRMHKAWAPVRIVMYTVFGALMTMITLSVIALIIVLTLLYIAYRIVKFFMTSRRRRNRHSDNDDDDDASEKLNNNYRVFRARLYAWEKDRHNIPIEKKEIRKPVIKRKKPKIKRKPKPRPKNDDIPRFHPD